MEELEVSTLAETSWTKYSVNFGNNTRQRFSPGTESGILVTLERVLRIFFLGSGFDVNQFPPEREKNYFYSHLMAGGLGGRDINFGGTSKPDRAGQSSIETTFVMTDGLIILAT